MSGGGWRGGGEVEKRWWRAGREHGDTQQRGVRGLGRRGCSRRCCIHSDDLLYSQRCVSLGLICCCGRFLRDLKCNLPLLICATCLADLFCFQLSNLNVMFIICLFVVAWSICCIHHDAFLYIASSGMTVGVPLLATTMHLLLWRGFNS